MHVHGALFAVGLAAIAAATVMLIHRSGGALTPYLLLTGGLVALSLAVALTVMAVRTRNRPPVTGRESIVGQVAVARSPLSAESLGRVFFQGTVWKAIATEPISPGESVQVVRLDGLTLTVRPYIPM